MSKLDIVSFALEVDYLHDIANKQTKFKKNIFTLVVLHSTRMKTGDIELTNCLSSPQADRD